MVLFQDYILAFEASISRIFTILGEQLLFLETFLYSSEMRMKLWYMVLELRHIKYNYKVLNISIYIDLKKREDSEYEHLVLVMESNDS